MEFSQELKDATKKVHSVSDHLVNAKLLFAFTNKELYGKAILLFYYIYAQLEQSLEKCATHEAIQPLIQYLPVLKRAEKLRIDLEYYLGKQWEEKYPPTAAVREYCQHLEQLETTKPYLLVPYCFHLYLAILAGGQMIKKMAIKAMKLPPNQGVRVFEMDVPNRGTFRTTFKTTINALPLSVEEKKEILAEAPQVFRRNNAVIQSHSGTARHILKYFLIALLCLCLVLLVIFKRY